jgi:hypothetical protein
MERGILHAHALPLGYVALTFEIGEQHGAADQSKLDDPRVTDGCRRGRDLGEVDDADRPIVRAVGSSRKPQYSDTDFVLNHATSSPWISSIRRQDRSMICS